MWRNSSQCYSEHFEEETELRRLLEAYGKLRRFFERKKKGETRRKFEERREQRYKKLRLVRDMNTIDWMKTIHRKVLQTNKIKICK